MSNDGNAKIEKIMNDTWSNRAIKNAKKYIALSSWKTEEEFDRSGLLAARRILRKLPEDKICNLNVLEIGGGIGRITKHMSKYVKEITMVDVSSEMAELARKRIDYLRNVNIYKTDGVKLPFPDNSFDIVYSIFVFQHMPRYIFLKNLADISRVLKNNGIFIFQIFEKKKTFNLVHTYWLRNLRNFHFKFWIDPPDDDTWTARSYSREELTEYLTYNGFGDIVFENLLNIEEDLLISCVNRKRENNDKRFS